MDFSNIARIHTNNLSTLRRSPLAELSGSLGDLGTLLPLMIALAIQDSISLSSTLVFSGLWNVMTGVIFGIPLPVQPMKAIAAVAISRSFTVAETVSAGSLVSGVVLLFSITGLLHWFTRKIPIPVVKGIQLGAGLSLVLSAGSSLLQPLGWMSPSWADNLFWSIFAFFALLIAQQSSRFPYALLMFVLAISLSVCSTDADLLPSLQIWQPKVLIPSCGSFRTGAIDAGLGQIPLTTLNSIIAVCYLSADLLPHIPAPTVTAMGISVAMMNLVGGWFGCMPVCHGSGGLAAQYRFGARSGASIIILGLFKILLGLFFGESLIELLRQYPKSLLGIMVLAAGLELAKVGENLNQSARDLSETSFATGSSNSVDGVHVDSSKWRKLSDLERSQRWATMLMTVGGLLAFKNDAVGFAAGMLCHWSYQNIYFLSDFSDESWIQKIWTRTRTRESTTVHGEEEQLLSNH